MSDPSTFNRNPDLARAPASQPLAASPPDSSGSSDSDSTPQIIAQGEFFEAEFIVRNNTGFHVRPATNLAMAADRFNDTDVWLVKDDIQVDAKVPLLTLTLADVSGTKYKIRARGPQAEAALQDILALVARKFDVETD